MWKEIKLSNYIAERFLGFSLPLDKKIILISYEGIHIINLPLADILINDNSLPCGGKLFDRTNNSLLYDDKKYSILGMFGGQPILNSCREEKILLDSQQQVIKILDKTGEITFEFSYDDLSGDWCFGTFSEDGKYVLLGLPYDFYIFERL